MYVQCSFCGYLNEQTATSANSVSGLCTLCREQLAPSNMVSMVQLLGHDMLPSCTRCSRELLLNGTCTYCTALYAAAPNLLLGSLTMFSNVLRAMHIQPPPPGLTSRAARQPARSEAAQEEGARFGHTTSPLFAPAALSSLWSAALAPPPLLQEQRPALPVLDFSAIDLSFLAMGVEEAEEEELDDEAAPLSERARAALLTRPDAAPVDFVCSVCLNPAESGQDLTALPCEHVFHTTCVNQWFMNRSTCPMCRDRLHRRLRQLPLQPEAH